MFDRQFEAASRAHTEAQEPRPPKQVRTMAEIEACLTDRLKLERFKKKTGEEPSGSGRITSTFLVPDDTPCFVDVSGLEARFWVADGRLCLMLSEPAPAGVHDCCTPTAEPDPLPTLDAPETHRWCETKNATRNIHEDNIFKGY